jgi:adenylate cyclase
MAWIRPFFRGKIVVIGGKPGIVSPKLGEDLFSTPFHRLDRRGNVPLMSGVEVQANMLVNLLRGNWLTRSGDSADLLFVLFIGLAAGWAFSRLRPFTGFLLAFAAVVLLSLAGVLAVHFASVWFPWSVAALVQLPVALVAGTGAHFYIERHFRLKLDAEQKRLREAFSKYLSPRMLERLTDEGFLLDPGGDKTMAAMMFTDIENFTDICQRVREPMHIVEHLNGYFQRTTDRVFNHDGGVIKYIGDAIFAAWGVPFADEHAAVKSVRAAWELHENAGLKIGGEPLRTRVGLHYGEVVAGNIGSTKHIDYTLIGDAVNLASRIEGLNKALGTSILLSEAVQEHLNGEFCTRRVGQFRVKGRVDVTTVYELLGPASSTDMPAWALTYDAALTAFESGDRTRARQLFEQTDRSRLNGDGPSKFFLEHLVKGDSTVGGGGGVEGEVAESEGGGVALLDLALESTCTSPRRGAEKHRTRRSG